MLPSGPAFVEARELIVVQTNREGVPSPHLTPPAAVVRAVD
jgi:hypothetical protein